MRATAFALALVVAFATVTVAVPVASAGPIDGACEKVLGGAKCEDLYETLRDLLVCTCPPL